MVMNIFHKFSCLLIPAFKQGYIEELLVRIPQKIFEEVNGFNLG
jgi:hypothetical protein